jgi:hypothetical protein
MQFESCNVNDLLFDVKRGIKVSEVIATTTSPEVEGIDVTYSSQRTVVALLGAAGLYPDADELDFFFDMYIELRGSADRLYGYGGDLEPAPVISVSHLYEEEAYS